MLPAGLENVKFGLVPELLETWENVKETGASGPLLVGWENVKDPGVTWLCVFSGSDSAPKIGLNVAFSGGLKLNSDRPKVPPDTSPLLSPKLVVLGKAPRLVGGLKLNPGLLGPDELRGLAVAVRAGVWPGAWAGYSPILEAGGNPTVGPEED